MPAISPQIALMFGASALCQIVSVALLPASKGFTEPLPTALSIIAIAMGMGLLARLAYSGVQLGFLIPLMSTAVPLVSIFVGIFLYGESASMLKIGMLVAACLLIGTATMV